MLEWIIENRGEPACEKFLAALAVISDRENVEETLCHIWAGFYDAENPETIAENGIRKHQIAKRRERKIAENRKNAIRKGVYVCG